MRFLISLFLLCTSLFAQPQRIVSTSPSITESLFALGLGDRVVGVSTYCHFPAGVERLPKIGTYLEPNVEVIARLKPDLVIVERLPNAARQQLSGLSFKVAEVDYGNLQKNLDAITAVGKATGAEAAARKVTQGIQQQLEAIRTASAKSPPRSVVFVVGRNPGSLEGLIVVGGGSYLSELMTIAGGRNIFADAPQAYLKTSLESLLRRNPDVLIDMGEMGQTVGVTDKDKQAVAKLWAARDTLTAVREHRIYAVASDIFVVPGPRMLDAAQAFAELIQREPSSPAIKGGGKRK